MPCRTLRCVAAGLGIALLASASFNAAAQDGQKPAPKPAAKPAAKPSAGKPLEPLLTREELRACMDRQAKVRTHTEQASALQAALQKEKADILSEGEALKADLSALDRANPAAVEAYNTRATARDQRISAFEPKVADFNAKVQALNDERASYSRDCENRRFDERDEKALSKP